MHPPWFLGVWIDKATYMSYRPRVSSGRPEPTDYIRHAESYLRRITISALGEQLHVEEEDPMPSSRGMALVDVSYEKVISSKLVNCPPKSA
jgi:hypothetical protein